LAFADRERVRLKGHTLFGDPVAQQALAMLREDFAEIDSIGPRRIAEFLLGTSDDALQADARGLVLDFLELWARTAGEE
jgi:hypothetical protein